MAYKEVPQQIEFSKNEEEILNFWNQNEIFKKSIEARPQENIYRFYDGPPFATGTPHYGHILAGVIKDVVPRYWTMKGFRIERRFGWDCHGLPIEYEIDKAFGISGRAGVEKFGIKNYNNECRNIVLRYTKEWEQTVSRVGRWVDFKNDYKTMDSTFMESVWWVFKQLWEKGLVYEGYRVMPYSTAVATPLSNFEASSNYKEVQDPALTVLFNDTADANLYYLAWTTTPWTLPSNLALSVGPDIDYVKIESTKNGKHLVLAKSRLATYFKESSDYIVRDEFKGIALKDKTYKPLFNYFADQSAKGAFRILVGDHVTEGDGTGIVHTAPAFGEDDYNVCQKAGISLVMPVDDDGRFIAPVADYVGRHVKECDKDIIARLKSEEKLFRHDTISHNYPFCWRSDTPLIYRAVSSWFVNVEKIKSDLIKNNRETHWVPENLRDGRFGNWLENARDWNISRNRYWGNPLPLWKNTVTGKIICIGSIAELETLSGQKISDLHRESLDDIELKCDDGIYKRVPEVLDCWFESGAMPYAQLHYPFENQKVFEQGFPADFIAEGLDQTRGWFYTLSILGTALFNKIPFKNVIVNGMVLAEDGKKMSKRLKNYPDPNYILSTYGADALRLYLIQSPAVRAEDMRFSELGVKDIVRRILLKWWNSYSFFINYAVIDKWEPQAKEIRSDNILDNWIISRLQTLLKLIEDEMAVYHLYSVVPALLDFIDDLTNVYIRLNRKRFWTEEGTQDKEKAYATLHYVLLTLSKIMAPFTPFLAETMFQNIKYADDAESVHLCEFPLANSAKIDADLEHSVELMKRVLVMGRNIREKKNIKVKIPLKVMTIIQRDLDKVSRLKKLEDYIRDEINVKSIVYDVNEGAYIKLTAKANGAILGKRVGKKFGAINQAVARLSHEQILEIESGKPCVIEDEAIQSGEIVIYRQILGDSENIASDALVSIQLDTQVDESQIKEGLAREIVNRIQKLRKDSNFKLSDRIFIGYKGDSFLQNTINEHSAYIKDQTLGLEIVSDDVNNYPHTEETDIDGYSIVLGIKKVSE